jgi:1-aminocyclopropane-1-carboxylate deaminase/D-cysteine desulfhydrase-like pyridoxal-dependent ACC family enzyme
MCRSSRASKCFRADRMTSMRLDAPWRKLPRIPFAALPTPLEDAPRLARAVGLGRLLIKREDLSGLSFGGNKSRLMEYVIANAQASGIDTVVACASVQSNKLREVAAAACRTGMRAVLLIDGDRPPGPPQGNLLLFDILGAEVRFLGSRGGTDVLAAQQAVQAQLEREGHKVAVLDRRLEYGALSTAAYAEAARELAEQLAEREVEPDRIFITAGAGMTVAGLALGLKHLKSRAQVVGVAVSGSAEALAADAMDFATRAANLLGIETRLTPDDFAILGGYVGQGYAVVTPALTETIRLVARHHGMVLDPVYNAKTMAALIDQVQRSDIGAGETVVYVNTGGAPALFAYNAELAAH